MSKQGVINSMAAKTPKGQLGASSNAIKTIGIRWYQYYDVRTQIVKVGTKDTVNMRAAYSKKGDYIGTSIFAYRMVNVYGIQIFEKASPKDNVCTIGFAPGQKKWFGWSHRARQGFGVGSKHKKQRATNLSQAKRFAIAFANDVS